MAAKRCSLASTIKVLERCAEATDDNRVIIRKTKRGYVVTGSNTSIYIEEKTLELAIARFSKELLGSLAPSPESGGQL